MQSTIAERVGSQERLVAAANDTVRLSQARYGAGIDSSLAVLDAQRTLYTSQKTLIVARLARRPTWPRCTRRSAAGLPAR